ncbi:hypothetical protein AMATHDRAFT_72415 [Amanita thiersii Skay4041]|uniref:U three protein 23 n=1 Tax=Amanita thiersii Skay4041 TaxID=703135 RepID=A0A2A9P1J1_9AGAR|nr:hypothetical protein AMATHDRAFT_72415 [Amanita thiersii Skay4041]
MRQKRAKSYRKLMHLYSMSFAFRQPYQVLVDSTMCNTAIDLKFELVKQLNTVLQGEIKPMITQCCIHELYLQGKAAQPAVDLAKSFERRKCNHREAIPGLDCISSVIGESNPHRYVVATQSHSLRIKLRRIPAVPLLHINRAVLILEPPSDATIKAKAAVEEDSLHAPVSDILLVGPSIPQAPLRKRKGPKGPNPLSMKKKKKVDSSIKHKQPEKLSIGEKRNREETMTANPEDEQPRKKRRRRKQPQAESDS